MKININKGNNMKKILITLSLIAISGLTYAADQLVGGFNAPLCQDVKFTLDKAAVKRFAQNGFIDYPGDDYHALTCSANTGNNVSVTCYPKHRIVNEDDNEQTGKPCIVGKGTAIVFKANIFTPAKGSMYMVQFSYKFTQDDQHYVVVPLKAID